MVRRKGLVSRARIGAGGTYGSSLPVQPGGNVRAKDRIAIWARPAWRCGQEGCPGTERRWCGPNGRLVVRPHEMVESVSFMCFRENFVAGCMAAFPPAPARLRARRAYLKQIAFGGRLGARSGRELDKGPHFRLRFFCPRLFPDKRRYVPDLTRAISSLPIAFHTCRSGPCDPTSSENFRYHPNFVGG